LTGIEKINKNREASEKTKYDIDLTKKRTLEAKTFVDEDKNALFEAVKIANKNLGTALNLTVNETDGRVTNLTETLKIL
jgi:hypothetical protein